MIIAVAAGIALLAGGTPLALASASSTVQAARRPASSVKWSPCEGFENVDCATVQVPIDHAVPNGAKFGLAMARHNATDPAKRVGVLFINPGGPGGSGVDYAQYAEETFGPEVVRRFDVIGIDPRGVGDSHPVICPDNTAQVYPRDAAEFAKLVSAEKTFRVGCRQATGPLYDHMSSADVADDMDIVRSLLGEQQISYYGVSYGTLYGQMYAERHGDKVRAMVIDSNMDHTLQARDFLVSQARTVEDSFHEWVKWNQRTKRSALYGKDVVKLWDGLMAKAARGELSGDNGKISALQLTRLFALTAAGPGWEGFSGQIARLAAANPAAKSAAKSTVSLAGISPDPFVASLCSDFNFAIKDFTEYSQLAAAERAAAPHSGGTPNGHFSVTSCLGSAKAGNPQHVPHFNTKSKVLVLNALHDPITPYTWATAVHQQTKANSALVTYDGWGHGAYEHTDCTRSTTDQYLVALKVPADGTHCAAQEPEPNPTAERSPARRNATTF